MTTGEKTHFGFGEIETAEKASAVRGIFSSVAGNYDLMNDLMSGGIHRLWKAALIDWIMPRKGQAFLDVAGGTGDVANAIREAQGGRNAAGKVIVADLTQAMLDEGAKRFAGRTDFEWVCANAEELPFEDNQFDVYTISFGLRNVARPEKALAEARRVLKPGGRFSAWNLATLSFLFLTRSTTATALTFCLSLAGWSPMIATVINIWSKAFVAFPIKPDLKT